jgi:hypothetical protein
MTNSLLSKTHPFAVYLVAILATAGMMGSIAYAQSTVVTTTTTQHQHIFHQGNFAWRHGFSNPNGIFQSTNIVSIPTTTLAQSVVNNCPATTPVLLSTGVCITSEQALQMIQTGQLVVGGQVQTQGSVVIGTPAVLGAQGFSNAFQFFGAFGHEHFHNNPAQATTSTTTTQTTP